MRTAEKLCTLKAGGERLAGSDRGRKKEEDTAMKYVCSVCGYVYDEEAEGRPISEREKCPVCQQPASVFKPAG